MGTFLAWTLTASILMVAGRTAADEVVFLNGDRLTGKIVIVADGELVLATETAGRVTIKLGKVKTFSSDGPLKIRLKDKAPVDSKVTAGPPGKVKTDAWPEPVPIKEITAINPHAPYALYRHENAFHDSEHSWYDLDAPTSPDYELDEMFEPHTGMFKSPLDPAINWLLDQQRRLETNTGLRVGFAYTHLFQQASGGPGERWATAGDADLLFDWTLIGRGTENIGRLFFSVEERFRAFSDITPSEMRSQIGSLVNVGGPFNDRGPVVRDLFWEQRLLDAKLRVILGRGAPDDYLGSHALQSANFGFINGNLAGNVTMAFPGHGPLAVLSVHPTEVFYANAVGANAYSVTTESSLDRLFDEGQIYGAGEVGVTPEIEALGAGRYAVTGWNMPGRELEGLPSDWGVNFTIEQYLLERLWVYGRYGYSDVGLNGVQNAYQAALSVDGLLGSPDNITGIGFGYAVPSDSSLRDEKSAEIFHRFQLTQHTQFSIGAQAIMNPANAPTRDVVGVFSFRLRFTL